MDTSTRTSEGLPSNCPICGKRMIVSICDPLGDTTCPHCGALLYPAIRDAYLTDDVEKRLADLGILVDTNDQGEITHAELHGPRFNDSTIQTLAELKNIPIIRIGNTGLTRQGIQKLREMMPNSIVEQL